MTIIDEPWVGRGFKKASTMSKDEALAVVNTFVVKNKVALLATPAPPLFSSWAQDNYYIGETKEPIVLMPYQATVCDYALSNLDGRFQTIIYSSVKKSGKTSLMGAASRYIGEHSGFRSEIYYVASDKEQARGRSYDSVSQSIELTPGYNAGTRILPARYRILERELLHLPTRSFFRAIAADYRGEAGSNPTLSLWCFDAETEALTKRGWLKYSEFNEQEEFATINPETNAFEWQKSRLINIKDYSGIMYTAKNDKTDLMVTPGHRIYGKFCVSAPAFSARNKWRLLPVEEAKEFRFTHIRVTTDDWQSEVPDDTCIEELNNLSLIPYARLMGWYISEGCTHKNTQVTFGQSIIRNPEKCTVLINDISNCNYEPKLWFTHMNTFVIYNAVLSKHCDQFGHYSHEKRVPQIIKDASCDVIEEFLETLKLGDGNDHGSGFRIGTNSKFLVDDLLELGQKCGYSVTYYSTKDSRSPHLMYRVSFYPHREYSHCVRKHQWSTVEYTGKVWCPSTENGIILVRRNGKVYWSGNTELWSHTSEASQKLWAELTPPPTVPKAKRIVETYAGYIGESKLLEDLYSLGMSGRRLTHNDIDWPYPEDPPIWVDEDTKLFMFWDSGIVARRMPWQQDETYYRAQAKTLRPEEFGRFHLNEWASALSEFIPIVQWDKCATVIPPLDALTPVVLAVDASVSNDCTAISLVSRHFDPARQDNSVAIRGKYIWTPGRGTVDFQDVEATIRRLCKEYNVVQVTYDEFQLHQMMQSLTRDGVAWCHKFSQQNQRAVADKQLYDLIMRMQIAHDGDLEIRQHIQNAAAKPSLAENGKIRLVKKSEKLKIDFTVATSMGAFECLRLAL